MSSPTRPPTCPSVPSFDALRRRYPALSVLAREADRIAENAGADFCANRAWYEHPYGNQHSLRRRVVRIADNAAKRYGQRAYDVCYQGIYDRLPDCRECGCPRREDYR